MNPKFSPDEDRAINLVRGLANNPSTTILVLPADKMVAYNGKIYILIEYKKMDIVDGDEYFDIELSPKSSEKIYKILISIVNSRVRQVEKKIIKKKEGMLDKMVIDASIKEGDLE
jgi:hypothetical protein